MIGPKALWNPDVWWQSILVWVLGAIIAHDLLLFPLYALADRSLSAGLRAVGQNRHTERSSQFPAPCGVPPQNFRALLFGLVRPVLAERCGWPFGAVERSRFLCALVVAAFGVGEVVVPEPGRGVRHHRT